MPSTERTFDAFAIATGGAGLVDEFVTSGCAGAVSGVGDGVVVDGLFGPLHAATNVVARRTRRSMWRR
jgi:hypothetical protein